MQLTWNVENYRCDLTARMTGMNSDMEESLISKWPWEFPIAPGDRTRSDSNGRVWLQVSTPRTIIDQHGRILAWILPTLLSPERQVSHIYVSGMLLC